MYYITYYSNIDNELDEVTLKESECVTAFIEEKINEHNYSLSDFMVVQGVEVNLRIIETPIKVLLTN